VILTYRYKLRPTTAQSALFRQFAGNRRFVWNWALAECKRYYAAHKKSKDFGELSAELTRLKRNPSHDWLNLSSAQSLQQAMADLKKAYAAFFNQEGRRVGLPRFKKKGKSADSFRFPQAVRMVGNRIQLPKIGRVRLFLSRPVVGTIGSATVRRSASGDWFVMLVVDDGQDEPAKANACGDAVGVDLGLTTFATCSDGEKIPPPRFFRSNERLIARLQRIVSRRKKGSNRRRKAVMKLAKAHERVSCRRSDFAHKTAQLVLAKASVVCVESLNIAGLAKTKLAKSIFDAGWRMFLHCLFYKAKRAGKVVHAIGRFEPSSKRCHVCGAVRESLSLSERSWKCDSCGRTHDRDVNAAINIKAAGQSALRGLPREFGEFMSDGGNPAVDIEPRIPRR
jgi:putative transposase